MGKHFHLDIITPTSIESFENVDYVRIPSLDGLLGIQAKHAEAIIGLGIGEVRITQNGKHSFYATSGGFADIASEGVQLLLETAEEASTLDKNRADDSLKRGNNRMGEQDTNFSRTKESINRAKNRLRIIKHFNNNK